MGRGRSGLDYYIDILHDFMDYVDNIKIHVTKNEEEDILRQSLIEMLNILENIAISVFGNIMWPQEKVDDQLISFHLIMMAIWISYSCCCIFNLLFNSKTIWTLC